MARYAACWSRAAATKAGSGVADRVDRLLVGDEVGADLCRIGCQVSVGSRLLVHLGDGRSCGCH